MIAKRIRPALVAVYAILSTTCGYDYIAEVPPRTMFARNIPSAIEITDTAKDILSAVNDGNPVVTFSQGQGNLNHSVNTDNLYIMSIFINNDKALELIGDINEIVKDSTALANLKWDDIISMGEAFALARISGGEARRHILSLAGGERDIGYYWPGSKDGMRIFTILITPDARFILQIDFSPLPYGDSPEYAFNFTEDMYTAFKIDGTNGINEPIKLLSDDLINELINKFS